MKKKKKSEGMNEELEQKSDVQENSGTDEGADDMKDKAGSSEPEKELTPEQLLEEQKKKVEQSNDKYLRLYAEFDNYRKRTIKERVELIQTSSAEIILALLPVLDAFDRAIHAFEQSNDISALKEGIVLVNNKFRNILGLKGLEEMKSIGEVFNSELHDAIANSASPTEEQKGKVIDEVEKGYYLNGKILRHAKVVVGN
jgi:molecular chaperone GrpE